MLMKVNCNHCQAKVDSIAKTCVHCGAEDPGKGKTSLVEKAIGLLLLLVMFWGVLTLQDVVVKWWNKDQALDMAKEAACKADLQCWGDKNAVDAELACGPAVERLAKYNVRWTSGALHMKFPSFRWQGKEKSALSYVGDKVEFQNTFGAYQAMNYICDYDPVHKVVLGIWAKPGRL